MPTYEYVCRSCGHEFEKFQSMKDDPVKSCPACRRRQVKRKIGVGAGVIFKGSGFYETDYKNKKPSGEKKEGSSEGKSEGDSSSKSESKSSSKSEGSSGSKSSKDKGSGASSGGSKKAET